MGKRRKKKTKHPPFARIERHLAKSEAWKSLDSYDIALYVHIRLRETGYNADQIELPYAALSWLMAPARFSKSIKRLVDRRLIKVVQRGGLFKKPNVYGICKDAWKLWRKDKNGGQLHQVKLSTTPREAKRREIV